MGLPTSLILSMIESKLMKKLSASDLEPPVKKLDVRQIVDGGLSYFETLKDEELPASRLDHINKAISELHKWVNKVKYKFLDKGSSREVYEIDRNYVLKIALDIKGITQNKSEARYSNKLTDIPIARVLYIDPKGLYLIQEKAEELDSYEFEAYYGIDWDTFSDIVDKIGSKSITKSTKKQLYDTLPTRLKDLIAKLAKHQFLIGDLAYIENWGIIDGQPVIVDLGGTLNVHRNYY